MRKLEDKRKKNVPQSLSQEIEDAVHEAVKKSNHIVTSNTLSNAVADAAYSVFDGVGEGKLMGRAKRRFGETFYSPFNIVRSMDVKGNINLSNINQLRSLETEGETYKRGTLLPSTFALKECMKKIERLADEKIPFSIKQTEQGESIVFDYGKVLTLLIKSYGLEAVGRLRSLRIGQTFDGAQLTRHWSHVMGGIKMNDPAAFCPLCRLPLYAGDFVNAQSRNLCFPMQLSIGKEGKAMSEHFRPMFAFGEQVRTIGIMGLLPLTVLTEIDMSATWKGLCRGRGAKQATYPCHCCGINSKDLARQNSHSCHRWCSAHNDPDFKCYHHEMVTDEVLEAMQGEVEELAVSLEAAAEAIKTSTLTKDDPHSIKGQENAINDPNSIWFRPNNTTERTQHSRLINRELRLRNLSTAGNATIRKSVLKESLEKEHKLARLLSDIKNCKRSESALFLLMNTIPCVLHMENRVGLKLLTMTLIEGITGASAAPTFNEDIVSTEKVRVQRYIKKVEDVVNTQILGTNENPSTWKVPYDEKKMELAPLSLENVKTRIIIDKLELLIEVSVSTADRQAKWNGSVRKYRIGMRIARQRDDFTDEDIAAFQKTIDEFFQDWVELHGMTGVTNYIHMLAAGHISTYMVEW